jgi:plasmid stability protein
MAQILVRNMEEQTVKRLKARARKKGHSLQAEVKSILEQSAQELDRESAWKLADDIRNRIEKRVGGKLDDSTVILRRDRDWRTRRLSGSR